MSKVATANCYYAAFAEPFIVLLKSACWGEYVWNLSESGLG